MFTRVSPDGVVYSVDTNSRKVDYSKMVRKTNNKTMIEAALDKNGKSYQNNPLTCTFFVIEELTMS